MKKLFIILGMHRSGTSVTARISQCMGAYLGDENELMGAFFGNQDGHFENLEIVGINKRILHYCGCEWYSLESPAPDYSSLQILKAMEEIKVVIQKLFQKSDTVAIKDPRISVMLPLWDKILKELDVEVHYIWVFRNPLEVMDSLRKRDGYSSKHSLLLWIHYNLSILKYLQGKDFFLIHYKDILDNPHVLEELSRLFNRNLDTDLKWELNYIIKKGYCHSNYSYQDVCCFGNKLLSGLYGALLNNQEAKTDVSNCGKDYKKEIAKQESPFMDYEALEDIKCLKGKEIIIYGAGNCGRQAAEILQQLGFSKYNFCDRDSYKHGMNFMNGKIFSIAEIEKEKNLLFVVAVESKSVRKEIEQTLICIEGACFLSFFALKALLKYFIVDYTTLASKAEAFSLWYEKLRSRGNGVRSACISPILVYQNGKVASSTISYSLWDINIINAHVHRFFWKEDIIGELILGKNQLEFIKKSNIFRIQSNEYLEHIKNEMRGKKIITLVREPIAVDLSTVFQWIGNEIADRYFAKNIRQGKSFVQTVSELMVRIQSRLFNWFNDELKELCGVDVLMYPFDKEKGYTIISKDETEILLIKVEKLSQMTNVIKDFIGNHRFELINSNVANDKEYAHIYRDVKKKIELPKEYVNHYYKDNPYMDHFYSNEEQIKFLSKWIRYIKKDD